MLKPDALNQESPAARRAAERAAAAAPQQGYWMQAWSVATSDQISLVAAGCAFYAMLALFPSISLCIAFYGVWFDLNSVEAQLAILNQVLPPDSYELIAQRVHQLVAAPRTGLSWGVIVSSAIALWSSSAGIRSLLGALNLAHGQREQRHWLAFYATAFVITICAILAVAVGLGFLVALPTILGLLNFPFLDALLLRGASMGALVCAVFLAIATLYRFGPARRPTHYRVFSVGAVTATGLWLVASAAFSLYVSHFATYDATYGPLGAAIALLTWLYVSVYLILLGAELDAAVARIRGGREKAAVV
ncbi:YihY/virulence factor BrkB family protein [Roseococcus sp.]|uniref:YihY/virulence factor BrkB family protein n=1 Tax=Roseococcus sp. TaxID=2109646 RepID=UPI003BACCCBF